MKKTPCQYCGQALASDANFCSGCGKSFKNKICVKCKTVNKSDSKYCVNCGTKLAAYTSPEKRKRKTKRDKKKVGNPILYCGIFALVSAVLLFILFRTINLNHKKTNDPAVSQIKIQNSDINEINLLKEKIKRNSNDLQSYIRLGNIFFDIDNKSEAIVYYKKALQIDSTNTDVRIDMAICYFESGDPETAIGEIEKSLKINPVHPKALYNLGIINYSTGRTEKAAEWWNKFLIAYPEGELADKAKELLSKITK